MNNDTTQTEPAQRYAAAHSAHYVSKDLSAALKLYPFITATHPDAPEAGYSRSQIGNIVRSVAPDSALLAAQVRLARTHLQ